MSRITEIKNTNDLTQALVRINRTPESYMLVGLEFIINPILMNPLQYKTFFNALEKAVKNRGLKAYSEREDYREILKIRIEK